MRTRLPCGRQSQGPCLKLPAVWSIATSWRAARMCCCRNWFPASQPAPTVLFPANLSLLDLVLIALLAMFSGIAGGIAGYGTGALMPLLLVPMVGAAPVVPI